MEGRQNDGKTAKKAIKRETAIILALVAAAVALGIAAWAYLPWAGLLPAGPELTATPPAEEDGYGDYFAQFRDQRALTRDQEFAYYDKLAGDDNADAASRSDARRAQLALAAAMEHELVIEQFLLAKGFSDCAVTVSAGGVNVVVKGSALTQSQTAVILEAVTRQTEIAAKDVFIVTTE